LVDDDYLYSLADAYGEEGLDHGTVRVWGK
jgi:hypothetical protein